jgi:hypothetical protein
MRATGRQIRVSLRELLYEGGAGVSLLLQDSPLETIGTLYLDLTDNLFP